MTGRADFLVDLEPALQLLAVELAHRPVAGDVRCFGCLWNSSSAVRSGGLVRKVEMLLKKEISSTTEKTAPTRPRIKRSIWLEPPYSAVAVAPRRGEMPAGAASICSPWSRDELIGSGSGSGRSNADTSGRMMRKCAK